MKMVIAAYLLVESCQHTHPDKFESGSRWGPLIDVLPKDIVPTLVTFDEDAYEALSDENLEANGKMAALQLVSAYFGDPKRGMREGIKDLLVDIIKSRIDPGADFPLECVDYAEFLRWISVMDSRSIAINGLIMILPLAHMINFEPQPDRGEDMIKVGFGVYKTLDDDGSITVRSDRDVYLHGSADRTCLDHDDGAGGAGDDYDYDGTGGSVTMIPIVDGYGLSDSVSFLSSHGMVTPGNPNNCGRISGTHFPNRKKTKKGSSSRSVRGLSGDEVRTYALLFRAFKLKKLLPEDAENFEVLNDICVLADGTIVGDNIVVGLRPVSDSIAMLLLLAGGGVWGPSGKAPAELRDKCRNAIESEDEVRVTLRCARYPGSGEVVSEAVRDAARLELTGPLTDDALRRRLNVARSRGKSQRAAALEFRLEDRRILAEVAKGENNHDRPEDEADPTAADLKEERMRTLPERVERFNDFIASLDLPVNKIEPRIVEGRGGDDTGFGDISMLGAFATEDIGPEEVYISLSPGSVIDAATAISEAEKSSPGLGDLLRRIANTGNNAFGDYHTIVLYLLHERFVTGERSRWWPYLDIMPTVDETSHLHPRGGSQHEAGGDGRSQFSDRLPVPGLGTAPSSRARHRGPRSARLGCIARQVEGVLGLCDRRLSFDHL